MPLSGICTCQETLEFVTLHMYVHALRSTPGYVGLAEKVF